MKKNILNIKRKGNWMKSFIFILFISFFSLSIYCSEGGDSSEKFDDKSKKVSHWKAGTGEFLGGLGMSAIFLTLRNFGVAQKNKNIANVLSGLAVLSPLLSSFFIDIIFNKNLSDEKPGEETSIFDIFRKNVAENIFFAFCNYCLIGCPGGDSSGGFFNMQSLMKFFAVEGLFLSHKYTKKNFEVEIMEMGEEMKEINEDSEDFVEGFKNLYENKAFKNDSSSVSKGTECVRYHLQKEACVLGYGYSDCLNCYSSFTKDSKRNSAYILDRLSIVKTKMRSGSDWRTSYHGPLNFKRESLMFLYVLFIGICVYMLLEEVSQNSSLLYALPIIPAIVNFTLFDLKDVDSLPDRMKFYFKNYFFYDVFYFVFNYFLNYNSSNYNLNFLVICGLSFYHRWFMEYKRESYLFVKDTCGRELYDLLAKREKVLTKEILYMGFITKFNNQFGGNGADFRCKSPEWMGDFFPENIFVEKEA